MLLSPPHAVPLIIPEYPGIKRAPTARTRPIDRRLKEPVAEFNRAMPANHALQWQTLRFGERRGKKLRRTEFDEPRTVKPIDSVEFGEVARQGAQVAL